MVSSKSLISTAFAGFALATVASAQSANLDFKKVDGPVGKVHYDLATGKVTKVVRPGAAGAQAAVGAQASVQRASTLTFKNNLTSGFFTTNVLGRELVDWASKQTRDTFMTAFVFGYATRQDDTSVNGPGASTQMSFYSGTTGFCTLGNQLARFSFTGLPGRTASIPPGFGVGYFVTAFLAQGLCVPNGQIGWSYTIQDDNGAGSSNSGPILTEFGTNTGWNDAFDAWSAIPASTDTCVGSFFFGGCSTAIYPNPSTPCASFLMAIAEYDDAANPASCTFRNAGSNPANLVVLSPPSIGGSFLAFTSTPIAGYAITAGPLPGIPLGGAFTGLLLCDPTVIFGGIQVTVTGTIMALIPKDAGLEGTGVCVQAAEAQFPGFRFTNAQDCVIGG